MSLAVATLRKLRCLEAPALPYEKISLENFTKMMLWLEEEKIRFYSIDKRVPLRSSDVATRENAIKKYLMDLELAMNTFDLSYSWDRAYILDAVASIALKDMYEDFLEENTVSDALIPKQFGMTATRFTRPSFCDDRVILSHMNELLRFFWPPEVLEHPCSENDMKSIINVIMMYLRSAIFPNVNFNSEDSLYPLSDNLRSPGVHRVIVSLQFYHGYSLRSLQLNVNNLIDALQRVTSHPKTNSRIGKTGR